MFALARRCFVVDAQAAGRPIDLKPAIVAYAGVPLVGPSGHVLGALAAVDDTPRDWSNVERGILEDLGRAASGVLRLYVTRQAALRDLRLLEADVAVDAATGALSDNGFRVRLEAESPRTHRFGHSVAVVCAAIVDLAAFSDRHGGPPPPNSSRTSLRPGAHRCGPTTPWPFLGGGRFRLLVAGPSARMAAVLAVRLEDVVRTEAEVRAGHAIWDGTETANDLLARADRSLDLQ